MRDFTLKKYHLLIEELLAAGFSISTVVDSLCSKAKKTVAIRHDVDKHIDRAIQMARMEYELGLKTTYYFRKKDIENNQDSIAEIASLKHEIGFHYEVLAENKGNYEDAKKDFIATFACLREIAWADGISMHGSPLSRYNNIDLWNDFSYRNLGVAYEATLDIRYDKVLYLTDTGRRWDCGKFNFRDRVPEGIEFLRIKNTNNLLRVIRKKSLPNHIILNIHPQRWSDNEFSWWNEYVSQHIKNFIKCMIT